MGTVLQDLRYGIRMLLRSPGFTVVAVLALALGIGADSAIFSVVNAVLLRPLPFEHPERLVQVWATDLKRGEIKRPTSYLNFIDWRDQNHAFAHTAAYSDAGAVLTGTDAPEQLGGVAATADLFSVLGVRPALGRTFSPEEQAAGSHVVVISHGLWQRRFGSDPKIVGQPIIFDGESTTVIGVMPRGFNFPFDEESMDFWAPLDPKQNINAKRGANYLKVVARLKPGTSLRQAQAEMDTIARRLQEQYPDPNTGRGMNLVLMHEDIVGSVRPALLVLLGAVGCVLLIACANVANLLLARAASRQKEVAIRTALGASRRRVVRQLLTESLLLSALGGASGLLIAMWGVDLLIAVVPSDVPRLKEIGLDARVLGFTAVVAVLTGLIFGIAPSLGASKPDLNEVLKEGGRGSTEGLRRNRVRSFLVISEVALSLILLIGAGLLIKSFLRLREVNPGFNPHHILTASVALPDAKYLTDARQAAFFRQLLQRVADLPGVQAAAVINPLPLTGSMMRNTLTVEGRPPLPPGEQLATNSRVISPDYLRVMGIPLVKGRPFTDRDGKDGPKVFLVNETLARSFFPGEDAIGKRVSLSIAPDMTGEIVGVIGDVKHRDLTTEAGPECYVSYQQVSANYMSLVVRTTSADPAALTPAIRNVVQQVDKDQPLFDIKTMEQLLADSMARSRFNMILLAIFASIALVLAAVGIFGVMNYSVTQRTHEIGVRIALGARPFDVLRMVVGQGMLLVLIGVVLGLAAAFALTRVMSSLLFGVNTTDLMTFLSLPFLLSVVALIACYLPARRATKVEPVIALRYE